MLITRIKNINDDSVQISHEKKKKMCSDWKGDFWSIYGWFLTVYLFSRVLDALRYLSCWGVSQLYDNFPSNTQNYSSGRVKAQTEGERCKYSQPTKDTLQVYYMSRRTWPILTVCMHVKNLHIMHFNVWIGWLWIYSHFQMCSSQIWFPVYRLSVTSSGCRLALYTANTHIPNSSIARQND